MGTTLGIVLTVIGTLIWNDYAKKARARGEEPTHSGYLNRIREIICGGRE